MQYVQYCHTLQSVEEYQFSEHKLLNTLPKKLSQNVNVHLGIPMSECNADTNTLTTNMDSGGLSPNGNVVTSYSERFDIREVWKYNLYEEFHMFRKCVQVFSYVLMDTKKPAPVARPIGEFRSPEEYNYQQLRCNVNLLDIIQLVFSFLDENGKLPPGIPTWQFNFKFDLSENMYDIDTITEFENSGFEFSKHKRDGINSLEFAALLYSSGIVLLDNIKWISFHSGMDFAYLVKMLTAKDLPEAESDFSELLKMYFPVICNIKNLPNTNENQESFLDMFKNQLKLESK